MVEDPGKESPRKPGAPMAPGALGVATGGDQEGEEAQEGVAKCCQGWKVGSLEWPKATATVAGGGNWQGEGSGLENQLPPAIQVPPKVWKVVGGNTGPFGEAN